MTFGHRNRCSEKKARILSIAKKHNKHMRGIQTTTTFQFFNYRRVEQAETSTTLVVDNDAQESNSERVSDPLFHSQQITNDLPTPMTLSFRQARMKKYFSVRPRQVLFCFPYKYNIRLHGVNPKSPDALYSLELHNRSKKHESEYLPNALQQERQVRVRGAPKNSLDYRIFFEIDSRQYAGTWFYIVVKDSNSTVLCTTCDFSIGGRGRKRTEKRRMLKKKQ